jgi:uncharacterized membrane protein (UPF0127 family)
MWLSNRIKYLLNASTLVLVLIYLSTLAQAENSTPKQLVGWKQEMIKIETILSSQDNIREHIIINSYIADTPIKRTQGLMHVTDLHDNEGMLFIFNPPRHVSMWMKDTVISLDILFIKADGTIAHVHKEAKPLSLRSIPSIYKVKWVLELKAGVAEKLKLRPGHKLIRD